ncbi:MAG: hypothetical protein WKF42_06420 [Solirubrobacteraceae bacterium]
MLIELDGSAPIITDLALYRELVKQAIARIVEQLRERAAAKASAKRASTAKRERTLREELDVEHRATLRELTRQAHGTNLDVGTQLLTELATVAPDDIDVARFFAFGLLGPESGNYLGTGDHVARTIAANGLRLVLDEHRTTTTPTLKSGKPGKTKVAYVTSMSPRSGCGGSSMVSRRPASCTAACSSCSPRSFRDPACAAEQSASRVGAVALAQGHRAQGIRARDEARPAGQPQAAAACARRRGADLQREVDELARGRTPRDTDGQTDDATPEHDINDADLADVDLEGVDID